MKKPDAILAYECTSMYERKTMQTPEIEHIDYLIRLMEDGDGALIRLKLYLQANDGMKMATEFYSEKFIEATK